MISPFTSDEIDLVSKLLRPRCLAGTVACPGLHWEARGAHFVATKAGEHRCCTRFFYGEKEQFGTGRREYPHLEECITPLLPLQSDHQRTRAGADPGATAADLADGLLAGVPSGRTLGPAASHGPPALFPSRLAC